MPRVLAVINQKGGVGKTSICLGIAGAVSEAGQRVLLIDMDPQANLSQTLLPDLEHRISSETLYTINDLLDHGVPLEDVPDVIATTPWKNVDLLASEQALANREAEGTMGIETRLKRILKGVPDVYDLILIDCPPSLGRLTVNALNAAQEVILLCEPDAYSQKALEQINVTLTTVREAYEHDLKILGLVINAYERTSEAAARTEQLREHFGNDILAVLPKRTVIAAAAGSHRSVFDMQRGDAREVAAIFRDLCVRVGLVKKPKRLKAAG